MLTRRGFAARLTLGAAAIRMSSEMAYAQRAAVNGGICPRTWYGSMPMRIPPGRPHVSLDAMREVLPTSGRYHYNEFGDIYATMREAKSSRRSRSSPARIERSAAHRGRCSSPPPTRPLISVTPAYEGPIELARTLGRPVVLTKLREDYTADVRKLAEGGRQGARRADLSLQSQQPDVRRDHQPRMSIGWSPICPPIPRCWWTRPTSISWSGPT